VPQANAQAAQAQAAEYVQRLNQLPQKLNISMLKKLLPGIDEPKLMAALQADKAGKMTPPQWITFGRAFQQILAADPKVTGRVMALLKKAQTLPPQPVKQTPAAQQAQQRQDRAYLQQPTSAINPSKPETTTPLSSAAAAANGITPGPALSEGLWDIGSGLASGVKSLAGAGSGIWSGIKGALQGDAAKTANAVKHLLEFYKKAKPILQKRFKNVDISDQDKIDQIAEYISQSILGQLKINSQTLANARSAAEKSEKRQDPDGRLKKMYNTLDALYRGGLAQAIAADLAASGNKSFLGYSAAPTPEFTKTLTDLVNSASALGSLVNVPRRPIAKLVKLGPNKDIDGLEYKGKFYTIANDGKGGWIQIDPNDPETAKEYYTLAKNPDNVAWFNDQLQLNQQNQLTPKGQAPV
jgi:hypothetical protein